MARHLRAVLVDTNVILECWRIKAWRTFAAGYCVETVEDCVTETQTGYQRRHPEQRIDQRALVDALKAVHKVGDMERAAAIVREAAASTREPLFTSLDRGEQALWAHALTRPDAWVLCGPDRASLRFGVRLGCGERLVAVEKLLADVGYRPAAPLRGNYTTAWHTKTLGELAAQEGSRRL
jgi:hypothetical protein